MVINEEKIFLETLNDIRGKIAGTFLTPQRDKVEPNKEYPLIKACGLLRHLLVDGDNLLSQVNRKYKISIEFYAVDTSTYFPNPYEQCWATLTPTSGYNSKKTFRLPDFLKLITLSIKKHQYSVKDVITTCSHVIGGVHSRKPSDDKEKSFVQLTQGNDNGIYMSINSICEVSLKALQPLENAVRAHTPTGGFSPQS